MYDTQGDVIGLLNSSGELAQTIRYGPYGENTNATAIGTGPAYSPTNDPFRFQGGYHTAGGNAGVGNVPNGLYHYGARYYDPPTARWTQSDPRGGGYEFDGDNPVNQVDPNGECAFDYGVRSAVFTRRSYSYIEVCGTKGKLAGKRVGYLRLKTRAYDRALRSASEDKGGESLLADTFVGCASVGVAVSEGGPLAMATGCLYGGTLGALGGDTTGLEIAIPFLP